MVEVSHHICYGEPEYEVDDNLAIIGEPEYEVDDNLAIIERETVDKVQAILDGLNGDEMERLLEMLKKKKPD